MRHSVHPMKKAVSIKLCTTVSLYLWGYAIPNKNFVSTSSYYGKYFIFTQNSDHLLCAMGVSLYSKRRYLDIHNNVDNTSLLGRGRIFLYPMILEMKVQIASQSSQIPSSVFWKLISRAFYGYYEQSYENRNGRKRVKCNRSVDQDIIMGDWWRALHLADGMNGVSAFKECQPYIKSSNYCPTCFKKRWYVYGIIIIMLP